MALERYMIAGMETGAYGSGGGTAVGVLITDFADNVDRGMLTEETVDSQVLKSAYGGGLKLSGTVGGTLRPQMLEDVLEGIWGINTLDPGVKNVYTLGQPQPLIMGLAEDTGVTQEVSDYTGVGISKFSLDAKANEFATWSIDWIAKDMDLGTYSVPSYASEDPLILDKATFSTDGGTTPLTEVKSVKFDIERKIRTDWFTVGDYKLHGLSMDGVTGLSGSLDFTEIEYAELKRACFGTTSGTSFPALNTLGSADLQLLFDDASGSPAVEINLPATAFSDKARSVTGRGEITKSVNFTAVDAANEWITYI